MIRKISIALLFMFLLTINVVAKEIDIHVFTQTGCPHCEAEKKFLEEYTEKNTNVKVHIYEISNPKDLELYKGIQKLLDKPTIGVPYTVIGEYALIGYGEPKTSEDIEYLIGKYNNEDYRDIVSEYIKDPTIKIDVNNNSIENRDNITLPILGKIDPKKASILLTAIVIGFVDGFNPCAMWILIFLISMLIGMKDKKKMFILGFVFIITSALMYMIFMLAWLNVAVFATKISIIRLIIGIFALIFGAYNIYKYTKKPVDGCEVVDNKKRKSIINNIKDITSNKKFAVSLLGIILLAVSVNIIELLCSAGLPFTFTNILALNNLTNLNYLIYIFVYIFFFMLDDLIIFIIAMVTFKVTGVSTRYSRFSSLIGGIIMLLIGLVMIIKPEILMFNL